MLRVSVFCFLASYLLAFGLEWTRFVARGSLGRLLALGSGFAGFIAQTWYLLLRSQQTSLPPLLSSMQDWLLVLAWLMVLVHLFISVVDRDLASGFIVWPLTILLIIASQFSSSAVGIGVSVHHSWTMLHVSLLVFGIAGVLLGFVVSLLYLWQHRRLKQRLRSLSGLGLPSLEMLSRLNRWALLVAVPLLTFGMITGIGLTLAKTGSDAADVWKDPIVLVSGFCWILMSALFCWVLVGRRPPGRQMAWMTAWACGFLLLTTVGAQILVESLSSTVVHGHGTRPVEAGNQETED